MEQQPPQPKPRRPRKPPKADITSSNPIVKDNVKPKPAKPKPSTSQFSNSSKPITSIPQASNNEAKRDTPGSHSYSTRSQTAANTLRSLPESKPFPKKRPYNPHAWLKHNIGSRLAVISRNDLQPDPAPVDSTSKIEVLCSYNWHKSSSPSIYVPGAPPRWTARDLPITIPPDEGEQFIDQNAYKMPEYPFEPIFRAMTITNPNFNFDNVDFVANRNSMRKLLNFVSGKVWEPFRIDLNMVYNTLFFTRREQRTREIATGTRGNTGYGHSFEDHFTVAQEGLEDSTSHHRVARYKFGDLDCVIRYEVDGCLSEDSSGTSKAKEQETEAGPQDEADELLARLEELSLAGSKPQPAKNNNRALKVVHRGLAADDSRLMELKSKSRIPRRADLIPQLWFGRIPYLAIGIHKDGAFDEDSVTITATVDDFDRFERSQQDNLRKIVRVIKLLKQLTLSSPGQACVIVCESKIKPLELHVYASKVTKRVLPQELVKIHWKKDVG